jgi:Kdo2-lipid IVA lauroyltransferase/acyltransferase
MLKGLLRLFSRLPLAWLHAAGAVLGWLVYLTSPSYASRLRENLLQSRIWRDESEFQRLLHANITETGKAVTELPAIWFRPREESAERVRSVKGWDCVERARSAGHGLILLTPHLGCFEVIPQYLTTRLPLTALYRPPHFRALEPAMIAGRVRPQLTLASTDLKGVRLLLKALKRGEAIGVLPDQVPSAGDGDWAPFFERPAYTMTLTARLAQTTGATVVLTWAERLPKGSGYALNFEPMPQRDAGETPARHLNRALEAVIRRCPVQYLWSYNRYKSPAGAVAAAQPPS